MERQNVGILCGLVFLIAILIIILCICMETGGWITFIFKEKNKMRILQECWTALMGKEAGPVIFHIFGIFGNDMIGMVDELPISSIIDLMQQYAKKKYGKITNEEYIDSKIDIIEYFKRLYYYGNIGDYNKKIEDKYSSDFENIYSVRPPIEPLLGAE